MKAGVLLFLVAGACLAGGARASAECVLLNESDAQRVARTPIVLLGVVKKLEIVLPESEPYRNRVTFDVIQAFKGVDKPGPVVLDFVATAEDFVFAEGQRVLLYATGEAGRYSTQCSRTRPVKDDDPELVVLRRLATR